MKTSSAGKTINTITRTGWQLFHNLIAIPVMFLAVNAIALFMGRSRAGRKIRSGIAGRRNTFEQLHRRLREFDRLRPRLWIHAASMGECEQAQPILRELHARFPEVVRVLTIFSPSADSHVSRQTLPTELVCYLPIDSLKNVRRFFEIVDPVAGVIIRHDFWPNFLWQARRRGVFLLLADASISVNANTRRHKPVVRQFYREMLSNINLICAVSESATNSLNDIVRHRERLRIIGDTRFDQVLFRARNAGGGDLLPATWTKKSSTLVAGSTWPSDEAVLIPAFAAVCREISGARMILVPHEPTEQHLLASEELIGRNGLTCVRFSRAKGSAPAPVLLVDRVGILAEIYAAGQAAFVGGAFGPGVHNVLEAAAHGLPVLFGPRMHNSAEALEMVQKGIGRVVHNENDCRRELLALLSDPLMCQQWGKRCLAFVTTKAGAAGKIVDLLEPAIKGRK